MKSLVKLFLVTCIALGFVACQDDDKDVDPTIRVTGTTVSIDGLALENIEEVVLDENGVMAKTLTIKASEAVKQDVDVLLEVQAFDPDTVSIDGKPAIKLPSEYYTIKQNAVVIGKGASEAVWTIEFKELAGEIWDRTDSIYIVPIRISSVSQLSKIKSDASTCMYTFDLKARDVVVMQPDVTPRYTQIIDNPSAAGDPYTLSVATKEISQRDVEVTLGVKTMTNAELTEKVKELYGDEAWDRTYAMLSTDCYEISSPANIAKDGQSTDFTVTLKELPTTEMNKADYFVLPVSVSSVSYGAKIDTENEADVYYFVMDIPKKDIVYMGSPEEDAVNHTYIVDTYTSEGGFYNITVPVTVKTTETPNQASTVTIEYVPSEMTNTFNEVLDPAYFTLNGVASTTTTVDFTAGDNTAQEVEVKISIPDTFFDAAMGIYAIPLKVTGTTSENVLAGENNSYYNIILTPPAATGKAYAQTTKGQYLSMDIDASTTPQFQVNKQMTLEGFISVSDNKVGTHNFMFNMAHSGSPRQWTAANTAGVAVVIAPANVNSYKGGATGSLHISMFGNNNWVIVNADAEGKIINPIEANKWYHIAVVVEDDSDTGVKIYVNGKLVGETFVYSKAKGNTTASNSYDNFEYMGPAKRQTGPNIETDFEWVYPQVVGGNTSSNLATTPKRFHEIRVWKTARTQTQIRSTMYDVPAGQKTDLVYYMKFDGGTATNAAGNGMPEPKLTGTPTFGTEAIGLGSPSTF